MNETNEFTEILKNLDEFSFEGGESDDEFDYEEEEIENMTAVIESFEESEIKNKSSQKRSNRTRIEYNIQTIRRIT